MAEEVEIKRKRSLAGVVWAVFGGLALLLVVGLASFHHFVGKPAVEPLARFADVLARVTQRNVNITGSTVVLEERGVSELAVVQRTAQSLIKYETRWLASDNLLIVRGEFLVKAGFDLSKVDKIEMVDGEVSGRWPRAEILSVELKSYEVFHSQNGTINRLQPRDQAEALRQLLAQARRDAREGDLREEAERRLRERLEDLGGGAFRLGEEFLP